MIELRDLSFKFDGLADPIIRRANLQFHTGEFALLSGPTGSGKSTLLKIINRLAPTFTGGTMSGSVLIDGKDISSLAPHDVAELIGFVSQKPEDAFVTDTVGEELAYGMEQLGFDPIIMRTRVAEIANLLDLADMLDHKLAELSGGEQQRVAIGAALTAGQRALLLDEPTSSLDGQIAEELISLLRRLADEFGISIILAEHRIERLLEVIDSVVIVHADGSVTKGSAASQFADHRITPPIIELGQRLGWQPLETKLERARIRWAELGNSVSIAKPDHQDDPDGNIVAEVTGLCVSYGEKKVLENLNFKLMAGRVKVIMGANGAGKSSALWAIQGTGARTSGTISTKMGDPKDLRPGQRLEAVAMVPQKASDLLFLNSVGKELSESDQLHGTSPGTTGKNLEMLIGRIDPHIHPRDLSSGQQLALVLATQLAKDAPLLLLDEPTRGLDYSAKNQLATLLKKLTSSGKAILLASHDVEFIAMVADEILVLRDSVISAEGTPAEILSPATEYATQMGKISGIPGFLVVDQLGGI